MSVLFGNGNCSGLVPPAGGKLVDLRVAGGERDELSELADGLPTVTLDDTAVLDLTLMAHGAYSPLDHFLGSAERTSVVEDFHLVDGSFFPWPVTLEIPQAERRRVESAASVTLRSRADRLLGVLSVDEVYTAEGRTYLGGRPRVLETPTDSAWRRFHWNPRETRECLDRYDSSNVIVFEGFGEWGEATNRQIWETVEALDGVLLAHPPGTPSAKMVAFARTHHDRACLAVLPWVTPPPGDGLEPDREVLARALVHRNYGANHLLVEAHHRSALPSLERHRNETGIAPLLPGSKPAATGSAWVEMFEGGAA